jgi:hypothetical protein
MSEQQMVEMWNNQPYFVIDDEAYNRIIDKLMSGTTKYEKTYMTVCKEDCKSKCKCPFHLSFIKDDMLVRLVNGKIKPVFSLTQIKYLAKNK